jgi:citrate synthase
MPAPRPPRFIDASLAVERLGIKKASLYSYVSRGLIRVTEKPGEPRARLYHAQDVDALADKKQMRRPAKAVARALDFGLPVLETSITRIEAGRLFYRGVEATAFAEQHTLEQTAELLWQLQPDETAHFQFDSSQVPNWNNTSKIAGALATDRGMVLLPLLLANDQSHLRQRPLLAHASMLVGALACAAISPALRGNARPAAKGEAIAVAIDASEPLHRWLASLWKRPEAADAIRQALVLCADHELNASTFAVRVVASTAASLTASLLAGLAALSGPRHGAMTLRVAQMVSDLKEPRAVHRFVSGRLARGEGLAGFGHPLYPDGDPRGARLLSLSPNDRLIDALCRTALEIGGLTPTLDVGLAALERGYKLPPGSGLALFTIGRSVGWVAHATEQRQSRQLIRPRARFIPG